MNAQSAIKSAAKQKDPELYSQIESLDLIAKEFQVHQVCYQQFTHGYSAATVSSPTAPSVTSTVYEKSNFLEVKEYVEDVVIRQQTPVSIKILHQIYGLGVGDSRYRSKLKQRLVKEFSNKIVFLSSDNNNLPEVITTPEYFNQDTVHHADYQTMKRIAESLRKDILEKFENISEIWPPDIEELKAEKYSPPDSVVKFFKLLFSPKESDKAPNVNRIIESLSQDVVFNVMRGKVMQQKHFILALGLHGLSASRKIIDIVHKMGHCLNYNTTCEIETAYAEVAQQNAKNECILPLQPQSTETVFTHFWVDNFDVLVDRQAGDGSVNTTHLVAFQKPNQTSKKKVVRCVVDRRRSRTLFIEDINIQSMIIDRKRGPTDQFNSRHSLDTACEYNFEVAYLTWIYLRKTNSFLSRVPVFKGWKMKTQNIEPVRIVKSVETYLPPIDAKVTEYSTIQRYMRYLQSLAVNVNMPYVNITLDVGAAMNAYSVIWNAPELYDRIVIHLGGFHFLKENFQVR